MNLLTVILACLVADLVFMGWWMITRPESPLPGYTWGGLPTPERSRLWGRLLIVCAVLVAGFLVATIVSA